MKNKYHYIHNLILLKILNVFAIILCTKQSSFNIRVQIHKLNIEKPSKSQLNL